MNTEDIYQVNAHKFAKYGTNSMYPVLGLAEEAGEACGKVSKFIRKHGGVEPSLLVLEHVDEDNKKFREDITKELGDVLWMIAEIATNYHLKLSDIMQFNISKLTDRNNRGVIVGEGDNR